LRDSDIGFETRDIRLRHCIFLPGRKARSSSWNRELTTSSLQPQHPETRQQSSVTIAVQHSLLLAKASPLQCSVPAAFPTSLIAHSRRHCRFHSQSPTCKRGHRYNYLNWEEHAIFRPVCCHGNVIGGSFLRVYQLLVGLITASLQQARPPPDL
jgi:hypothetical protein